MGVWVSLLFDLDGDVDMDSDVDAGSRDPPPTRANEERSLADSCKLVHESAVTLMMYLIANPRDHVEALCRSIGEGLWTKEAQMLLRTIWNSIAGRWFCAAVEADEDVQAANEDSNWDVALAVPWNKSWSVTDCALLIRSICFLFSAFYLDGHRY
jgi:hypothetical protein